MALSDLLQRIKSALGMGSNGRRRQHQSDGRPAGESHQQPPAQENVDVTVEREPETASEDAVKGTETASEADSAEAESTTEAAEPTDDDSEAESEKSESTEAEPDASEGDTEAEPDASEGDTEAESDASETTDDSSDEAESDEADDEAETAEATEDAAEADLGTDESVDVIKGIGATYAERLEAAGIETVADLAASDPEALAEESGISETRLSNWVEKAKHR